MPKQKVILPVEQLDLIKEMYLSGQTVKEIGHSLHIGKNKICRLINEMGIMEKPLCKRPEVEKEIVEKYKKGELSSVLAKEYNCCQVTIWNTIKKYGVKPRNTGGVVKQLTPEETKIITNRWLNGESQSSIAKDYNLHQSVISRFLMENGVEKNENGGARGIHNAKWKGGIKIQEGYIYRKIPYQHKYFCMTDSRGYVAEHRLVMAESRNRILSDEEQVHHINGIKDDNRIENLELRQGNHGIGIKYKCNCCGSLDVSPVELGTMDLTNPQSPTASEWCI